TGINWPETNYGDNEVSVNVKVDLANLRVEILGYPEKVTEGDTATVTARVFNESKELVGTRLIWKVDGNIVKDVPDFDLISQADTAVSFKVPDHDVTVEVVVNPDRNAPPDEITYDDNSASCYIVSVPKKQEVSGDLRINAPDAVEPVEKRITNENGEERSFWRHEPWNFTVRVTTRRPRPGPGPHDPPPPPPVVVLKVNGESQINTVGWHYLYGTYGPVINNEVKPLKESWTETYTADWGYCERTFTFTFPWSGTCGEGNDITASLAAQADCDNYGVHLTASKNVKIVGTPTGEVWVQQTR
ncbi:MAG: hypothetical protein ACUVSK_09700, partial [Desulfotomaculales bacterium]